MLQCIKKSMANTYKDTIMLLYSGLVKLQLKYGIRGVLGFFSLFCCCFFFTPHQEGCGEDRDSAAETCRVRGFEHVTGEDKMKELKLFILVKRQRCDLRAAYNSLKGSCKADEAKWFLIAPEGATSDNGPKTAS